MPLGARYAISRDRFLILNHLKQLSACRTHGHPSTPCTSTFIHRARSTRMGGTDSASDNVIARLLSSNAQWATDVASSHPDFFHKCCQGQQPKVLWIGCADSRVPESVVTACEPGQIFTHRNIANQFHEDDLSAHAVLEYAVGALGVSHIVVAGHTNCGGAIAALNMAQPGPDLPPANPTIYKWLHPLIQRIQGMSPAPDVLAVIKENVKMQIENICQTDIVSNPPRTIQIHGWLYRLEDGLIENLQLTRIISPH